ncbi:hypothetical protein LCGC14_2442040 [marine sediment metagenome]|uniref:Right handed beta helix domain-containing protein n=1 Tax=marine sediment metagenome TaxID=412755 RepID=A0A0F9C660_9ZZZZ
MANGVVFDNEKTVFFASDGDGAAANASGCLKSWWDTECPNHTEAEHVAARDKMMDVDGYPIFSEDSVVYTETDQKITISGIEAFAEVGMLAYIYNGANIVDGIYEITVVGTGYIICGDMDDFGLDDTVYVIIGGEFLLQDALDETDATDHSVEIHIRDNLTLVTTTIDINMGGGNNTKNTFKKISGYNTSPGDMDYGGTYYQSPCEILQAGSIDNAKAVLLDGNDDDYAIVNISIDGLIVENIHLYDSGSASPVVFTSTPQGVVLRNCRVSSCNRVSNTAAADVVWDSCYIHNDLQSNNCILSGGHHSFINCVANLATGKNFIHATGITVSVIGCLIAGNGNYGIRGQRQQRKHHQESQSLHSSVTVLGFLPVGCGLPAQIQHV